MFEAFREQVKLYQRVALSKVAARQVVQASPSPASGGGDKKAKDGKASILPIVPTPPSAEQVVGAGEAVIGKGKEQVLDALSNILSSAARKQTQVGGAERVMQSVMSSQSAAVAAGKESVRRQGETAASAASAAGVTVTDQVKRAAETVKSAVSGVGEEGSKTAEKVVSRATAAAAQVTEGGKQAGEKVQEAGQDAMESIKSVYSEASAAAAASAAQTQTAVIGQDAARVAEQAMAHDEL